MEKIRAGVVKAELARLKREEEIKSHVGEILSILTGIMLAALTFIAFVIDAFGFASIPSIVYVIGFIWLGVYAIVAYRNLFRR